MVINPLFLCFETSVCSAGGTEHPNLYRNAVNTVKTWLKDCVSDHICQTGKGSEEDYFPPLVTGSMCSKIIEVEQFYILF